MQGAKVLVVDDSTSVRKVLEKLLMTRGLHVMSSENAEQGLEAVGRDTPHLVIADVVMPGMSGFELCQLLKLNKRTQDIPVILISGIVNDGVISQAQQAGAFDVVSKPFTPDDLFPKVDRALKAQAAQAMAAETKPAPQPATPSAVSQPQAATPPLAPVVTAPIPAEPEPLAQAVLPPQSYAPVVNTQADLEQDLAVQAELKPFLDKPEIENAMVISAAGKPLAWVGQPIEDPETFATYTRTLLSISKIFGDKHQLSPLQGINLEYLGKTLIIIRISENTSLTLLMRGTGGTGVVRYLITKQMPHLKAALGEQ